MIKRRRFGQHYLVDLSIVERVVEVAAISRGERVLEIGTGKGVLTRRLAPLSDSFEAYEIDAENYDATRSAVSASSSIVVHLGDAFEVDASFDVLVSSLPYSESSNFVEWLSQRRYDRAVVILQDDFVRKLLARPGQSNYRAISAISQISSDVRTSDTIHREAFAPSPRVDSVLVTIRPRLRLDVNRLALIKLLFSQRRRRLGAAIKHLGLSYLLTDAGKAGVRVSELSPERVLDVIDRISQCK